jgi:hypothetical protein
VNLALSLLSGKQKPILEQIRLIIINIDNFIRTSKANRGITSLPDISASKTIVPEERKSALNLNVVALLEKIAETT